MKLITRPELHVDTQCTSSVLRSHSDYKSTIAGPSTLCIDAGFEQLNEAASSDENDEMDPDEVCLYEEIMRLMSTIDSKGNYKPFKSNVAAMAYLLAHSPRPMLCSHMAATSNMFCRICNADTKIQKQDLQKQHGITDVLLHLPMNLHRTIQVSSAGDNGCCQKTTHSAVCSLSAFPSSGFTSIESQETLQSIQVFCCVASFIKEFCYCCSTRHFPTLRRKSKIHLLLHFPEHMQMLGPTSCYNTERCESYNSLIRCRNIHSNRQAPSKVIANSFAIWESIRFAFAGSSYSPSESTLSLDGSATLSWRNICAARQANSSTWYIMKACGFFRVGVYCVECCGPGHANKLNDETSKAAKLARSLQSTITSILLEGEALWNSVGLAKRSSFPARPAENAGAMSEFYLVRCGPRLSSSNLTKRDIVNKLPCFLQRAKDTLRASAI
ncbi:hypothetical protein EMCRGX_G011538 [Ephydatia muelleri]